MNAPQIIRTPGGEELVLLARADYDALIGRLSAAEEDAADIAAYDDARAKLESGAERVLSADETNAALGVGPKLRALRKLNGVSQSDLSERSGLSQAFISKLERGDVSWSVETRQKICAALAADPAIFA